MKIFDCATQNIKQGGRRQGANMGVLRVDHPDIMEFISSKQDQSSLGNFNISVGVTDAFMEAVSKNQPYQLVHPGAGRPAGRLEASRVFRAIVEAAWQTGDPGLLFLDTINQANPTPHLGTMEATNPCGEVPLLPYESCNLGSINLAHMLRDLGQGMGVDWEKLRDTVRKAVRFLDDVIEVNRYPLAEIERMAKGKRKVGLGVMGFAEMVVRLGISYDSEAAVRLAEQLMRFISTQALQTSQELASERGVFPFWLGRVFESQDLKVRNATCTAIAPTGTISIIANTSASIEPYFALAYRRTHVLGGQTLYEVNRLLLERLEGLGLAREGLVSELLEKGNLRSVAGVPEGLKDLFVTALQIPLERQLLIQAAFQQHVDNCVSKTLNLPQEASVEDVATAYWKAWKLGLKGVTVYRRKQG